MCIDNPTKRDSQYGEAVFAVRRNCNRGTVKPQLQYGGTANTVRRNGVRHWGTCPQSPTNNAFKREIAGQARNDEHRFCPNCDLYDFNDCRDFLDSSRHCGLDPQSLEKTRCRQQIAGQARNDEHRKIIKNHINHKNQSSDNPTKKFFLINIFYNQCPPKERT